MNSERTSPQDAAEKLRLPMARVKVIMKSTPQIQNISQDSLFLVTKAAELFLHYLSEKAHGKSRNARCLDYKHLADVIQTDRNLEFVREIVPRKITFKQYKEMLAKKEAEALSDSDTDSLLALVRNSNRNNKVKDGKLSDSSEDSSDSQSDDQDISDESFMSDSDKDTEM